MHSIAKVISLVACSAWMLSCGLFSPDPTQTPVPTDRPTSTPTPTNTPTPIETSPPTASPTVAGGLDGPTVPELRGEPVSEWRGIPVMAEAIAGEEDRGEYVYIVAVSPKDVETYYIEVMPQFGWTLFVVAESEGKNHYLFLLFQKDDMKEVASVKLVEKPGIDLTYVWLTHRE